MRSIYLLAIMCSAQLLLAQTGTLDLGFGNDGKLITNIEEYYAKGYAVSHQSDGKIILAGTAEKISTYQDRDIVIIRYLSDGTIDPSFAENGIFNYSYGSYIDNCFDIAIDDEDSIYFTGSLDLINGYVGKLTKDGDIDQNFGNEGFWVSPVGNDREEFHKILLTPSGKLIIAGSKSPFLADEECTLIKLNSNGTLDTLFGNGGISVVPLPENYISKHAAIDDQGNIYTGGYYYFSTPVILKFTPEGIIDSSFAQNGILVENNTTEFANDIAIQPDGKILIAVGSLVPPWRDLGVVRYTQDGILDSSFGDNGRAIAISNLSGNANSIILQRNGKILITGQEDDHFSTIRFTSDGQLDESFSLDGVVSTDFGLQSFGNSSTVLPNQRLLVAGYVQDWPYQDFAMAQYYLDEVSDVLEVGNKIQKYDISPNPTSGAFTLSFFSELDSELTIDLISIDGLFLHNIIEKKSFQAGDNKILIDWDSNYAAGVYMVRFSDGKNQNFKKVVVTR